MVRAVNGLGLILLMLTPCVSGQKLPGENTMTMPSEKAAACVQRQNKIGIVGLARPDGSIYAAVGDHDDACGCSFFRFDPENTDTKVILSLLLAAKTSQHTMRVDLQDGTDCTSAFRAYMGPPFS